MSKKKDREKTSTPVTESAEELYENAPCGYVSFLTDGTIFNINKTLLSWLGYSREEVVHIKKFNSLFKIGGKIFFETHFFPLIRIQGFIKEINFDIVRKDTSTFPGLLNVNEITSGENVPKTYRATIFDITDRKLYETELLEARKKAELTSAARAEFLATISHEIRTPLNAILGIGNLIQDTGLNQQQKEYARILLLSSENLLGLVNNLLDLSKIEAGKVKLEKKSFDLAELIEVLVTTYEIKAKQKNIRFLTDFEENLPTALIGDPVKINQILTNLIGNAIKFTDQGFVKLHISTIKKDKDHALLQFKVSDTGIGIEPGKLQMIFREFSQASYQINLNYGGSGLGLNISQKLLLLYGSEMKVSSEPGKGSAFFFELELKLNKTQIKKEKKSSKEITPQLFESARVLIVDDNPTNIFITSEYLKGWNLSYDSVQSGRQAIEAVQNRVYELVLMDLHMPEMDGYETARTIRKLQITHQPVIIALSASGRGDVNIKQRRAGINDYVPKPFRPEELFEALAHHLKVSKIEPENIIPPESGEETEGEEGKKNNEKKIPVDVQKGKYISFDLSRFIQMAHNHPATLEKFITNTAKAFEGYKETFKLAAAKRSSEEIKELFHKSTMSIFYIQANNLTRLLEESIDFFSDVPEDPATVEKKVQEILVEFDTIINGLKSIDASDLLEQTNSLQSRK